MLESQPSLTWSFIPLGLLSKSFEYTLLEVFCTLFPNSPFFSKSFNKVPASLRYLSLSFFNASNALNPASAPVAPILALLSVTPPATCAPPAAISDTLLTVLVASATPSTAASVPLTADVTDSQTLLRPPTPSCKLLTPLAILVMV